MPTYEYDCDTHGCFELERPMREAQGAAACPACGADSRRILSVANVPALSASNHRAHAVNERSCFEPRVAQRPSAPSGSPERKLQAGHGRPWSIGH